MDNVNKVLVPYLIPSDCQQCSNLYLLLIIPIGVSGLLLVIVMFVMNLTVSEGTINPFIFYVQHFKHS